MIAQLRESTKSGTIPGTRRATQLVFSDLSTPDPDRFNVYSDIRSKLVAEGVPPKEIAFIHDAETDTAKKLLFDGVNAGRVRILLGSTEKMGAGTNVQRRLVALHHLDAPWRPRDIEQREGRILRQGNTNKEVQIYRYVTEGSFDAYMWQTLETKARFIHQVMRGETSRSGHAEDLDRWRAHIRRNQGDRVRQSGRVEKIKVDTEIRKLDQLRASHVNQQHNIRWSIKSLPEQIERGRKYHQALTADIATREAHADEEFTMTIGNREFSGKGAREEAGKTLNSVVMSWCHDTTLKVRGHYKGFEILSRVRPMETAPRTCSSGARKPIRRISIPTARRARYPASNTRCAASTGARRRSSAKSSGRRKRWPITRRRWTGRSSMRRG